MNFIRPDLGIEIRNGNQNKISDTNRLFCRSHTTPRPNEYEGAAVPQRSRTQGSTVYTRSMRYVYYADVTWIHTHTGTHSHAGNFNRNQNTIAWSRKEKEEYTHLSALLSLS